MIILAIIYIRIILEKADKRQETKLAGYLLTTIMFS